VAAEAVAIDGVIDPGAIRTVAIAARATARAWLRRVRRGERRDHHGRRRGSSGVVGVARRVRQAKAGPAAAVIVLPGRLPPGAARASGRDTSAGAQLVGVGVVARGVLAVLTPPPIGRRWLRGRHCDGLVDAAREAELTYLEHIVLHPHPVAGEHLGRPEVNLRPHTPFWGVHTCLEVFSRSATDPSPAAYAGNPASHEDQVPDHALDSATGGQWK